MFKTVGMPEFYQDTKSKTLNIIDVREENEYQTFGHIPGANNVPLSKLNTHLDELVKGKEYHIVCQSGSRSNMAAQFLGSKGYNVVNVMGGMGAWRGELE